MRLLSIRHIQLSHLLCQKSLIHSTHLKNHSIPSCNEVKPVLMIFSAKVANDHNITNLLPIKKPYQSVFLVFVII